MSNRTSLYTLIVIAILSWGSLLLFIRLVPPATPEAFLTFFLLLLVALTSTFTPITYLLGRRFLSEQIYTDTARPAMRQSALLALVIVLNLMLRALHSWNIFTALVIVAAAIVVEVLSLAKK